MSGVREVSYRSSYDVPAPSVLNVHGYARSDRQVANDTRFRQSSDFGDLEVYNICSVIRNCPDQYT